MRRPPRHHWIPRSVLGPWVVRARGIPWNKAGTGQFVRYDSIPETAQVRGGNWAAVPENKQRVSVEEQWTRYFDDAIAVAVKELRVAQFDSPEMCSSARALIPGIAGLVFRSPTAAESRLDSVLALHEALRAALKAEKDLRQTVARYLGLTKVELADLRIPENELRRIAEDPPFADDDALHDVVTGPFFEAMLARDQWLIAQPVEVAVERATGNLSFQIGDCIVLVDELGHAGERPTRSTIIWDVAHWVDEPIRLIARGKGRHLRLTFPVAPDLRVVAEFRGRRSGTDVGTCGCVGVGSETVREHNESMRDRSQHWVFGSAVTGELE